MLYFSPALASAEDTSFTPLKLTLPGPPSAMLDPPASANVPVGATLLTVTEALLLPESPVLSVIETLTLNGVPADELSLYVCVRLKLWSAADVKFSIVPSP